MLIALKNDMVVGPLTILRLVNSHRLAILVQIIIEVVSQYQPMVVGRSLFLNAEQPNSEKL